MKPLNAVPIKKVGPTFIPVLMALVVWLSPLAFVPVPWPDDSAFYFVAHELFKWPPRWVMLPQAPFEPSYAIYNFNTMPLYPLLIGLGRFIGIDGSHALKLWPLMAWGLSGSILVAWLARAGLPWFLSLLVALVFALDPALRWASVLVRPESLIGLFGMIAILLVTFKKDHHPQTDRKTDRWISLCLAGAAYAHFNAIHLVAPIALGLIREPRRLFRIGLSTALLLLPWVITVLLKWDLFIRQMTTQWTRLAVHNGWLDSLTNAVNGVFQSMGSPEPWPDYLKLAAVCIWGLLLAALAVTAIGLIQRAAQAKKRAPLSGGIDLLPAAAWLVSAAWLWETKPEVWFTYYLHLASWCFAGVSLLKLWPSLQAKLSLRQDWPKLSGFGALGALLLLCTGLFAAVDNSQARHLGNSQTWHWDKYHQYIDCIDRRLSALQAALGNPQPFQIWAPTFPDITIELVRRHPDWQLTRTNDFWDRHQLGIRHGYDVDAVVIPETLSWQERTIDAPQSQHPEIHSVWMDWTGYYYHQFMQDPAWKPNRHLCQVGRWQAFIYMKPEPAQAAPAQSGK